jgi:hypothetical protein
VPASFFTYLRRSRRPIAAFATGLILLQTMLAGLATAHDGALAANPFVGSICHGTGNADPDKGNAPDGGGAAACCVFCSNAGTALVPDLALPACFAWAQSPLPPDLSAARIVLHPRAVRAGSAQAPPIRA